MPVTPAVVQPPVEPAPSAPPALTSVLGYREIWSRKPNGGWAKGSVIIPSGDLASISGGTLTIHARHDGHELESKAICAAEGPRAVTVLRGNLYIACNDKVVEVTLPGLGHRVVLHDILKGSSPLFREAAFGGDKVVYTHNSGSMEVYSTTSWALLSSHNLAKHTFAQQVAVSGDGKRLTITDDTDAKTVLLFEGTHQSTLNGLRSVLAFSPDGTRVFGSSGSFKSGDLSISGGGERDVMETGSWLTAAVYLSNDRLVVAGSDGIFVKDMNSGQLQELVDMTAETLAVSPDGNLICGADRGDKIACFGQGTIAPSTYKP
jgi:hypothetical protein